jgi:hypothetical protein
MDETTSPPWREGAYYSTGRDALRALLEEEMSGAGSGPAAPGAAAAEAPTGTRPPCLWLPSYYCPDVVRTLLPVLATIGFMLRTYPSTPPHPAHPTAIPLEPGHILLVANLFGLQGAAVPITPEELPPGVILVEDHTHDPLSFWARCSRAHWCFASLRKTLPLPDGGVAWSPAGRPLPRPPALTLHRRLASVEMLAAMTLRRRPEDPGAITGFGAPRAGRETLRELELKAEARLQSGPVSGMAPWTRELLEMLPLQALRGQRRSAHRELDLALTGMTGVTLLGGGPHISGEGACAPYPAVLVLAHPEARQRAQRLLESAGVPALVLWKLDAILEPGMPPVMEADARFSRRMLALPEPPAADRTAALVRRALRDYPAGVAAPPSGTVSASDGS